MKGAVLSGVNAGLAVLAIDGVLPAARWYPGLAIFFAVAFAVGAIVKAIEGREHE